LVSPMLSPSAQPETALARFARQLGVFQNLRVPKALTSAGDFEPTISLAGVLS